MSLEPLTLSFALSVLAIVLSVYSFIQVGKGRKEENKNSFESTPLRLQAYERLVLLTERLALPSLISRLNQPALSAVEMKLLLIETIKAEFEYNSTQQLYVSQLAWDAVRNLKEQEVLLINQVHASLNQQASAAELNRRILDVYMAQTDDGLNVAVTQTLNQEAKKLMR